MSEGISLGMSSCVGPCAMGSLIIFSKSRIFNLAMRARFGLGSSIVLCVLFPRGGEWGICGYDFCLLWDDEDVVWPLLEEGEEGGLVFPLW